MAAEIADCENTRPKRMKIEHQEYYFGPVVLLVFKAVISDFITLRNIGFRKIECGLGYSEN